MVRASASNAWRARMAGHLFPNAAVRRSHAQSVRWYLWIPYRDHIDPGVHVATRRAAPRDDPPVAQALERIEPGPVVRQLRGLKQVNVNERSLGVEDQPRITE